MRLNDIIVNTSIYRNEFLFIVIGLIIVILLIFFRMVLVRFTSQQKKEASKLKKPVEIDTKSSQQNDIRQELDKYINPKEVDIGTRKISFTRSGSSSSITGLSSQAFDQLVKSKGFVMFDMSELWSDYKIRTIYMSLDCCSKLNNYLNTENIRQIEDESSVIPEIGGILLGRFNRMEDSFYRISLEEFIPIESVNPDLFSLEFCTDSLVREMGDVSEKFPHLTVMGWFHTHPGHGLFLSVPDMTIQMGFFKEPYQVAMEIDSLSKNLDTGFFCQKANGQVNNSAFDKKNWFSWHSIVELLN